MAFPAHKPDDKTRAEVKALAAVGVREDEISTYIGISAPTLRKHYRDELDKAHIQATANVARALYAQATGGSVAAAIFWMKARGGWREKHEIELSGPDGGPIRTESTFDASQLSDGALQEFMRARRAKSE